MTVFYRGGGGFHSYMSSVASASGLKAASGPAHQSQAQLQPNQTLYVNNLNTKIKKPELKRMLYALFSPHGQVLSIVASKTAKARGQAFIVYKDLASAVVAMRSLQGYPFYDKSLRIQFAKSKSEAAREMDIILSGGTINYGKKNRNYIKLYFIITL
jgi:RNA recognition motif-containing protein